LAAAATVGLLLRPLPSASRHQLVTRLLRHVQAQGDDQRHLKWTRFEGVWGSLAAACASSGNRFSIRLTVAQQLQHLFALKDRSLRGPLLSLAFSYASPHPF
ncbi:heat repeat family related protein, partial [Cyclospora cayetanensis]